MVDRAIRFSTIHISYQAWTAIAVGALKPIFQITFYNDRTLIDTASEWHAPVSVKPEVVLPIFVGVKLRAKHIVADTTFPPFSYSYSGLHSAIRIHVVISTFAAMCLPTLKS